MKTNEILLENRQLKERVDVLEAELAEIKSMDMFEFGARYCTKEQLEYAGKALGKALIRGA